MARFKLAESYFLKGMVVTLALLGIKVIFEQFEASHRLEEKTYTFLMQSVFDKPKDPPRVVVLDISHLPGGTKDANGRLIPTPRKDLLDLIHALVPIQPKAIGIDIDFSPSRDGLISRSDPKFFDECLKISGHIPIKLGVFRTIQEASDGWLGVEEYRSLAAAVWLPKKSLVHLPVWVSGIDKYSDRMPSMGAALASAAYRRTTLPDWATYVFETGVERRVMTQRVEENLKITDRLIDHSFNDTIWNEKIERATPEKIAANAQLLAESIVILGDTVSARERFEDPRSTGVERTGVIFHAATAQTLAANDLFEFTGKFRYILDILISALVVTIAGLVKQNKAYELLVILVAALGLTLIATALLFSALRVLWLDFFVVFGLLLLHVPVRATVARLVARLAGKTVPQQPAAKEEAK